MGGGSPEPPPGHVHTSIPPTVIAAPPIVIPAQAGTTRAAKLRPTPEIRGRSNVTWTAVGMLRRAPTLESAWIPAFTGMTERGGMIVGGAGSPIHPSPLKGGRLGGGWKPRAATRASSHLHPPPYRHSRAPDRHCCAPDRHSRALDRHCCAPDRHSCAGRNHARDKASPCLKHPAALERHLGSPSECRGVHRRWRPPGFLPSQE